MRSGGGGGGNMSTPQPASEPAEPLRLKYGMRDTVAIHAGTAQLISNTIDRIFVVDYHMAFKAPDLTPLVSTAPVSEPPPPKVRTRAVPRVTPRTRKRAAAPVDQPECAAAAP